MPDLQLPPQAALQTSTPTFDEESVPASVCSRHALPPGRWGILKVLTGSVWFLDLSTGKERRLTGPEDLVIAPEAPHKLRLEGPLTFRIDLYQVTG